ncbi:DUF5977 domain-containing protein [Mucilaginibacter sp. AK015]|uniref:DUF5977 domain-containing protein n=1 Tax=Mucilaginibacter sp. AK015 TaxID=2723072 RepID=UPI00161E5CC5|nr:DUF5977 domain-containing protein [Mucilaginibacter sp. AK015]
MSFSGPVLKGSLFVCFMFFCGIQAMAQKIEVNSSNAVPGGGDGVDPTYTIRTDLIPASPNASSLGKYGELPLNLSTGAASLNIPVFTVTGHDLSLPITLNYNYTGLRPTEQVGFVGLGWTLNAGGVITRTIRGRKDNTGGPNQDFEDQYVVDKINTVTKDNDFLNGVFIGNYDTEPDIYSFNFGNYSGKFIKYRNKFYCFPYQKIKISGGETGFTIITEDGTSYVFNEVETISPKGTFGVYNIPSGTTSSWYLTKITNAAGTDHIYLQYTSEGSVPRLGALSQTLKKFLSADAHSKDYHDNLMAVTRSYPTWTDSKRLSSITSEKYTVSFIAGQLRGDMLQESASVRALDKISIQNSAGQNVKYLNLKHNNTADGSVLRLDSLLEYKRVMLGDDIIQIDSTQSQKYVFHYLETDATINNPVTRADANVDHYGYYRGSSFVGTIIPNTLYANGVDRSPNENVRQGAMFMVKYPTGGYSTFEYEPNRAFDGNKYKNIPHTKNVQVTRGGSGDPNAVIGGGFENFTLNFDQTVNITVVRVPKTVSADSMVHQYYKDFIINKTVGGVRTVVAEDGVVSESDNGNANFSIFLTAGDYDINAYCDVKENAMSATINYKEQSNIPEDGAIAGGIRVKRITSNPVIGAPVTKEYVYTNTLGFSSGVSMNGSYEQRPFNEKGSELNNPLDSWNVNYMMINSTIAENYYMGVPHYYTSVLESVSNGAEKLSTRTSFNSYSDYLLGVEPVSTTQYKMVSGALLPLQRTDYNYEIKVDTVFRGMKPIKIQEGPGTEPYDYDREWYQYPSAWKYLVSTKTSYYTATDTLETITYNDNDVNGTRNLVGTSVKGSDGKETITRFKYPENYTASIASGFTVKHVLDPVLEKQVWTKRSATDSGLVASVITKYDSVFFKPAKVYSTTAPNIAVLNNESKDGTGRYSYLLSDSRNEERINFAYDSYGNLTDQRLKGGVPVSYKWGYAAINYLYAPPTSNKIQVIAECKNATSAEFFYENFEEITSGLATGAHTGLHAVSAYAANWTPPNGRAYIISYWYRTAGAWKYKKDNYTGGSSSYACTGGDAYDDVCIYPVDAQISTYTYDPGLGVNSITDARGETTTFEYDSFHRLVNVRDRDQNILKNTEYHYIEPVYWNDEKHGTFTRECAGTGSPVVYSVPADTYKAVTLAMANAQAQADVDANGQAYANLKGICQQTPFVKMVRESGFIGGPEGHAYGNYSFSLWQDQAGTIPLTANLPVTIKYQLTSSSSGGTQNTTVTATVTTGNSAVYVQVDENTCGIMPVNLTSQQSNQQSASSAATTNTLPGGGGDPAPCTSTYVTLLSGSAYFLVTIN